MTGGTTTNLYSLTVGADAKGAVALRQLKFVVSVNDVNGAAGTNTLSAFKFFRGSTDLTQASVVTIMNSSGTDITASNTVTGTSQTVVVSFYPEEVISAGSSYTYTLKATPANFSCSSGSCDSVSTVMSQPTDTTPAAVSAGADAARYYLDATANSGVINTLFTSAAGAGTGTAADVIWSDNSGQAHDATYTGSSADWFNGYLINNLPLDSIGIVAQ